MVKSLRVLLPAFALLVTSVCSAPAAAAPFTPGNLVIYRVGSGSGSLANTGNPVFLDEYTTAGVLVQSIALPTTVSGSNRQLIASGTASSEGLLTRSADSQYLILTGYASDLGGAVNLPGSSSATINRTVGRVSSAGTIDTSTALTDFATGSNPRGAASSNGTDLWVSGGAGGIRYTTLGGTTSTQLSTTVVNLRQPAIFAGQLYVSTASGTAVRIGTVGTGLPTTSGQTITNLPGFPATTGGPYAFVLLDLDAGVAGVDTLYVADDTALALTKYSLVSGNWTSNGVVGVDADDYRGLTATVSGPTVTLYATRKGGTGTTGGGELVSLTDSSGYNGAFSGSPTLLATAAGNTAFRGVALAPGAAPPPLPNLTIDDVSLDEGDAGTTTFTFTVSLSAPAGPGGVTFDIATQDNTATTADNDYVTNSLTGQTIPAGSSTYAFNVTVNGDTTPETNETFFVNVSNVTGAIVGDGQGTGTIQNDDAAPTLTIDNVAQPEGDSGTSTFTFTVSLDLPAGAGGVSFDIATQDNTATTADNDYVTNSLTGQTIPAGQQTYSFDVTVNGDTTVEPDQTFFVNVTNVTGAIVGDGQGLGTIQNDDFTRIHDIQGPGATSPIVGSSVTTRGIVTGVRSNGFFIQEPDASVDADPATSEGILVFTSSAPPAAAVVGNYVEVTGTVTEFFPSADTLQPRLTELTSPTVVQLSTGNPLPAAIPLSATFPDPAGPHDQLERLEGMRVSVASLTVVGPTLGSLNEPNATSSSTGVFYGVVTGVPRPFREAGIQAPDPTPSGSGTTIPPVPRFDSNPERIRVDSDGLVGGPLIDVGTGAVVTGLVGPLDYSFRTYTILPDPGAPAPGVAGGPTATAVTPANGKEFTVASYNMQRFYNTVDDPGSDVALTPAAYDKRLAKASLAIRNSLNMPDIIGIAEMENLTTLQDLATRISTDAVAAAQPDPQYTAHLVEGNDIGGIDVAFLVKTAEVAAGVPRVTVNAVVQELDGTQFINLDSSPETLNDRPPLRLDAVVNHPNGASFPVTVIANHLRSLNGVNSEATGSNGWPTVGARVRAKRQKQAEDLANLVQARQVADPTEHIILVGDFNAFEVNDGLGHSMGVIGGTPAPDNETAVAGDGIDLVNPDFDNLFDSPPPAERYSYIFDGNAQNLDHILINAPLDADTLVHRIEHARVNADFPDTARNDGTTPVRLSDHDPVVAYFEVGAFADPGSYFTVTPCRAVDTRMGTPLQDGVPQTFALHGVCGIPATAASVVLNVTSISPTGDGELTIHPSDAPPPGFSALPLTATRNRALIVVVPLSDDAAGEVAVNASVAGGGMVHLVLDVMGYFE